MEPLKLTIIKGSIYLTMPLLTLQGTSPLRRFVLTSITTASLLYLTAALAGTPPIVVANAASSTSAERTQLLDNPGFEEGTEGWSSTLYEFAVNSSEAAHRGEYVAWLGGAGQRTTQTIYQDVSIPADVDRATFSFWINIETDEITRRSAFDKLYVQVRNTQGRVLSTLATYSNLNRTRGFVHKTFNLSRFAGRDVQVSLKVIEDRRRQTSFFLDDVTLTVQ